MSTEIICKNYIAGEKLREIITKKVEKLGKYFDEGFNAKINLSENASKKFTMEITLKAGNSFIRAETTGGSQYDNIDVIMPKIEKQIVKFRGKREPKTGKTEFLFLSGYDFEAAGLPKITKKKAVELEPMTPDEAIERIELIGHDFFAFLHSETERINILYKRKDGDYGLIDLKA